jgi:hypothetical protein
MVAGLQKKIKFRATLRWLVIEPLQLGQAVDGCQVSINSTHVMDHESYDRGI